MGVDVSTLPFVPPNEARQAANARKCHHTMSSVNIKRAVDNIHTNTTVYTPVVECLVNAIQAIDECPTVSGQVELKAIRSGQANLDASLADITGFAIHDNGIGFTERHRSAFDTLYTDHRYTQGGKGFGRFTCLKYFDGLHIDSVYKEESKFLSRKFSMGKKEDIIVGERVAPTDETASRTVVTLSGLKVAPTFEKKLATVARKLVEHLLPYFITDGYECPRITLAEQDGSQAICLNEFLSNAVSPYIKEIQGQPYQFNLKAGDREKAFSARIFKLYSPKNQKSRISLVAHKREVPGSFLERYVPEFAEDFYTKKNGQTISGRNYIIKAYVFGPYLDENVSLERVAFNFRMENDLLLGISQTEIERQVAEIAQQAVGDAISLRKERKKERVQTYVNEEAPWHRNIMRDVNLNDLPHKPTDKQIEQRLYQEKMTQEFAIKGDVERILSQESFAGIKDSVIEVVGKVSDTSKNDLVHYIALRRNILSILKKSLERGPSGGYSPESVVHDIVFPIGGDTDRTPFHDHNLWILDERLNFTDYVSSDLRIDESNPERPDLLVYDNRVLFRGDNEQSNPITIFEFKRPQRDDFVDPSAAEDPVQQIVRYVNRIREGKGTTRLGRSVLVTKNTSFYGYVVCDFTPKIESWLELEKNFTPMPDRLGWFHWMGNINLYIEVISWDKVLKNAEMRSKVFFHKLGI